MVFFACNGCGEPLKKKTVEKHNYRCRSSQGITCIDCHKIFGDDYLSHTSCISEQEKYGGTNFTPKEMKGQRKQEEWIETLNKVAKELDVEPRYKKILNEAACSQNVPRNKKKLKNYFNNQFRMNLFDAEKLADLVMNKAASIDAQKPKVVEEMEKKNIDNKPEELKKRKQEDEEESLSSKKKKKLNENNVESKTQMENSMDENQVLEKSKKKKKSKGKDREVSDSVELEHTNIISNGDGTQEEKSSKKKKSKTKAKEIESEALGNENKSESRKEENNGESDEMQTNGKMKKKGKKESASKSDENKENVIKEADQNSNTHSKEQKDETSITEQLEHDESVGPASEFKWKVAIKKALKANDSQMKLKKLEKVVIEEYLNFNGNKSLETEAAKELFKKKINNDKFIIEDKYVKLK